MRIFFMKEHIGSRWRKSRIEIFNSRLVCMVVGLQVSSARSLFDILFETHEVWLAAMMAVDAVGEHSFHVHMVIIVAWNSGE